jgi:hypothetical protein
MSRSAALPSLLLALVLLSTAVTALAQERPAAVSPSGRTSSACPTFSWSANPKDPGYELVAVALTPDGEVAEEPVLTMRLPAGVQSWTPSLDRCLEPGKLYAWSVRVHSETASGPWSQPALVEVSPLPSFEELARALATIERFSASKAQRRTDGPPASPEELRGAAPSTTPVEAEGVATPHPSEQISFPRSVGAIGAAVVVRGEVRTIDDSGAPRLWGRGREDSEVWEPAASTCSNGSVHFGLSGAAVDWGSASDACTEGTWVCTLAERGSGICDTARPNLGDDYLLCDGTLINADADKHVGWLADRGSGTTTGLYMTEHADSGNMPACIIAPVWCCWR